MTRLRNQRRPFFRHLERNADLLLYTAVLSRLCALMPTASAQDQFASLRATETPILEFIAPTNHAVFSTRDEIPIVLRAFVPGDVVLSADLFANQQPLATAVSCCPFCPCPPPMEGQETILQIPVPWEGGPLPDRIWQGWTNVQAGHHTLTAAAVGANGSMLQSPAVSITVLDLTLKLFRNAEGDVTLVIPQGSLVQGVYELETSDDLRHWTWLGTFQPGNVAAFYFDEGVAQTNPRRFYRAVYHAPASRP